MINLKFSPVKKLVLISLVLCASNCSLAYGLKDVFKNLHINTTSPGNYQDAAAGWYSGGSSVIRTKSTAVQPVSVTAPSLSTGCNGIDVFMGSASIISSAEIAALTENIGSGLIVYGLHLGMKTYAPQIEQVLKDLRNLQMQLNQFGIGHCKATQAAFAAALPKNTAMYETVCNEMASAGGADLGLQRKSCKDNAAQREAVRKAQERDPELLMDNYNLFIKAANAAGIPKELHASLMSMTGTIVVKNGVMIPYPSLANNLQSWNIHINGGDGAGSYSCNDAACLNISINNNVSISAENSYSGLARSRLTKLRNKMHDQGEEFSIEDKGFIDSIGHNFPIFDHITLEAVSGISILDSSSQLVARAMLLAHLESTVSDVRKATIALKQKQINDKYLIEYEASLLRLFDFAAKEWGSVMTDADRINDRALKIEKHLIARERG